MRHRARIAATLALLISWPAAAADAGDIALGLKPEEVAAMLKPLSCKPIPDNSPYQICVYFPPPETHKHLKVEALESFAGFPVNNASFAFLNGALEDVTLTFPSGRALRGSTVDPLKLTAALEARFGPPTERRHVERGPRGGGDDLITWERPGGRWVLHLDSSGGANAYLVHTRRDKRE